MVSTDVLVWTLLRKSLVADMLVPRCCSLPEIRKLSLSQQPSVSMGLGRGRWWLGSGYTRNVKYRLQRPETDSAPDVAHIASPHLRDIFLLWNKLALL